MWHMWQKEPSDAQKGSEPEEAIRRLLISVASSSTTR